MRNKNQKKYKLTIPQIITKFEQFLFLSFKLSGDNILWESASSCSYSFIFSFIPVILIIFTILASILNVSPGVLNYVLEFCNQIESVYDFKPLLNNISKMKSWSFFNVFISIWVIWMARKLFLSIVQGMNRIFRSASNRKTVMNQVFTFVSEFVLVILFIIVIITSFTFNKFLHLSAFDTIKKSFPRLLSNSSNILVASVMYFMFFLFGLYSYKFLSGTKPKWRMCAFYSFLSTGIIFVISFFINKFMNFYNYNIIYGTISTLLVLLFKVYMFFVVFLFCAQMLYVSQFLEDLIISQIYTMQNQKINPVTDYITHFLFDNPSVYKMETEKRIYHSNEVIFSPDEVAEYVYYIHKGSVILTKDSSAIYYKKGNFFGEISGFLNAKRINTATAAEDCELILIKTEKFLEIIHENNQASKKALERLNSFTHN